MGACGCSDTDPDFKFPGPEGVTYAIQIYPSCHYCGTPAGVDIHRFNEEWAKDWLMDQVDDAPWLTYGEREDQTNAILGLPVLDPEHLSKSLAEVMEDEEGRRASETNIRLALPEAVHETFSAYLRMVAARRRDDTTGGAS